jgi:hypothetical protein
VNAATRWGWIAVVLVFVAAGVIFALRAQDIPSTATPSSSGDPTRPTEVVNVVAVDGGGNPAPGFTVVDGGKTQNCYRALAAVDGGVVTCSGSTLDPVCWVTPVRSVVLCGNTFKDKELRRVVVEGPVETREWTTPRPWGLKLADGKECFPHDQSQGRRADGLIGFYVCQEDRDNSVHYLLGRETEPFIDRTKPVWTVRVGDLGASSDEFPPPAEMRVVTAYFAASK